MDRRNPHHALKQQARIEAISQQVGGIIPLNKVSYLIRLVRLHCFHR